jgi:hypothetical protein
MKKFIKDKVKNSSLSLDCHNKLRKFYEQCGLKYVKDAKISEGIVMAINGFDSNDDYHRAVPNNRVLGSLERIEELYDLSFDKKEFSDKTSDFFVQ